MGAKGEVIAMNVYVKNIERSQINYLMLHLWLPHRQEQGKPKTSRRER
jgi:hypothetical protein